MTGIVTEDVTCLGCGCACDDIAVVVRDARIVEARHACPLGARWFGDGQVPANCRVDGRSVSLPEAIAAAGHMLTDARWPFVYLAPGASCETQREAAGIADLVRGRLDSVTSATASLPVLAGQEHGCASATLGEIRNRADVVVFWGIDLEGRYPRFASRYAPDPAGTFVPLGRQSRTVVAVDIGGAKATIRADRRIAIDPADELATLISITALAGASTDAATRPSAGPDAPWPAASELATSLLGGRYVAIVYDAEPDERAIRSPQRFHALASLSQVLNDRTRCAAIALRAGGNRSGADSVLVAQTGYPFAIDFARGYPRYDPHHDAALAVFARRDVDVALVAGDPGALPQAIARQLAEARSIVIGPRASAAALGDEHVVIDTGVDGIHSSGTALRSDDVPLPLRATLSAPQGMAIVVRAVAMAVRHTQLGDAFEISGGPRERAGAQP